MWFARFEAIADDNDGSEQERLSALSPKLQGAASEYVFECCPRRYNLITRSQFESWMHAITK